MGHALTTDLYELDMAASYLHRGMGAPATFSLYVRALPRDRGFLVAAGIDDCLDYLERLRFEEDDLSWLAHHGFPEETVDALGALRFTGDVEAVEEGRVVLAGEPLLEVTAPLPQAQLVETSLLNHVTFQTAIASKAARCRIAAGAIELVDFALRRVHGTEAGMAVARLSAIAGFSATSNVEAAKRLGLRASGTMAHSYVQAFGSEEDAFRAFVEDLPPPHTFLVDTYDALSGVEAAARVVHEHGLTDRVAVRLDSGDVGELARAARGILDREGLGHVRIVVSGGLDEYRLSDLVASGAPVDAAGVGTRMGTSADAPYVDSVYKLVELDGRPVVKLSPAKETLPGPKQIWRSDARPDVLACRAEPAPPDAEGLLVPAVRGGRRLRARSTVAHARARLERDLEWLPAPARRIRAPETPEPVLSDALQSLAATARRAAGNGRASAHRD